MAEVTNGLIPLITGMNYAPSVLDAVLAKKETAKSELDAVSKTIQGLLESLQGVKDKTDVKDKKKSLVAATKHVNETEEALKYAGSRSKPKAKSKPRSD